jgi:hypothetical protein
VQVTLVTLVTQEQVLDMVVLEELVVTLVFMVDLIAVITVKASSILIQKTLPTLVVITVQ